MGSLMSGGGLLWGGLASYFGLYVQATIPFGYTLITVINLSYFAASKNFRVVRFVQVLISLILPFLFQWSLGGFAATGAMMLWALLALVGAMSFQSTGTTLRWLAAYLMLTIVSGIIDPEVSKSGLELTPEIMALFFTINMTVISAVVVGLTLFFVSSRYEANSVLAGITEELKDTANLTADSADEMIDRRNELEEGTLEQKRKTLDVVQQLDRFVSDLKRRNMEMEQIHEKYQATITEFYNLDKSMIALEESSASIGSIVRSIDEVAFQTNLLALNAAVEAARAGSAGAGFAVVADEVRALASKSAQAAKEVSGRIENNRSQAGQTRKMVGDLKENYQSIEEVLNEVMYASQLQQQEILAMGSSLHEIEQLSEQSVKTAAAAGTVTSALAEQADGLRQIIAKLESRGVV